MTIVKFLIPMSVCLFCLSCDDKIPPEEAILGKWMLIAYGPNERNLTYIEPDNNIYKEFHPNGTQSEYSPALDATFYWTYRLDAKCLYINEDDEVNCRIFKYKLTGNRLKLTYVRGIVLGTVNTTIWIYKRKK